MLVSTKTSSPNALEVTEATPVVTTVPSAAMRARQKRSMEEG